MGMFPVTRQQG